MVRNLAEGNVRKTLWQFTLPMFVSVIFQQMYNLADSAIAGKYAGESALAAVGASYPITMIFMAIAVGSNIGCAVVISQYFGGGQYRKMKTAVSTTMIASTVVSLLLTVLGLILSRPLLRAMHTPEDIFYQGDLYLRIYILGLLFLFLYNVSTGVFTSLGDSRTPLYFLIGSSVGNIVLDYIFVAVFGFGVAGVAWATFIAQGLACILAVLFLAQRIVKIQTTGRPTVRFSMAMLRKICRIAVPSILQQSFVSVGNLFIQGLVNSFGSGVLAGYSAAVKLNNFAITSFSTIGNGVSSFTAQNIGAGKPDRVKKGFFAGTQMVLLIAVVFLIVYLCFGKYAMSLFMENVSGEAMGSGVLYLHVLSPFYLAISIKLVADGILRGASAMSSFMISTFTDLILRVVLAFAFSAVWGSMGIWLAWPVGWVISTALSLVFYARGKWKGDLISI
ncbi:MAG: MATE family efflux transporter [Eubacterium sp.]|nr:MATE family efflux transporter [Eubacterium sp.]